MSMSPSQIAQTNSRRSRIVLGLAIGALAAVFPATTRAQLAPQEAAKAIQVPEGMEVTLFASEPLFSKPTNIDIDEKGRVWVTEGDNYRKWEKNRPAGDRIVCLEDSKGTGLADKATVLYQGTDVNAALGICVIGDKVIVSDAPNVFVLTKDKEDKLLKKEVLFSGISGKQHDHAVHSFTFGPDGKLYFNFGNAGEQLKRPDGSPVIDVDGNEVANGKKGSKEKPANSNRGPYRQGMVFRCNLDGSDLEVLGWNFRNNFEVAVDSFGTLWQSDNDDDGNRGVRIAWVMEKGNFGYVDEMTGANWGTKRTNLEKVIPARHWHLNDPGVVPNLIQTGGGSPTGICFYEGNLLPEWCRNRPIHCDAGPNVVRLYPVVNDGAGYTTKLPDGINAKTETFTEIPGKTNEDVVLMKSTDKWFRPSDACVAPDGSVYVADWYDPGVGGHNMGDNKPGEQRGRIYRLAPKGSKPSVPPQDFTTAAGCVHALTSPNLSTRYHAWTELHNIGAAAEADLIKLWNAKEPRLRAPALNLLARIEGKGQKYVDDALKDTDPDIRISGIRIGRELKLDVIPMVKTVIKDPSPQVRREAAIALRRNETTDMPQLWAELAAQHDGKDRFYLEALGIGADGRDTECFTAWLSKAGGNWNTAAGRDIIFRTRGTNVPDYLAKVIADKSVTDEDRPRYFRSFDFLPNTPEKSAALSSLLESSSAIPGVAIETLGRLREINPADPQLKTAISKILGSVAGTPAFVDLVDQFGLKDQDPALLDLALAHPNEPLAGDALRVIIKNNDLDLVQKAIADKDNTKAAKAVTLLGSTTDKHADQLLLAIAQDEKRSGEVRSAAIHALARTKPGATGLLNLVKQKKIGDDVLGIAGQELHTRIVDRSAQRGRKTSPTARRR